MSAPERKLQYEINLATYYYKNRNTNISFEQKAKKLIQDCYLPFETNLPQMLKQTSISSIVDLAEVAFLLSLNDIASKLIKIYFELDSTQPLAKNSYYIRALLVKAQVEATKQVETKSKAEAAITILTNAVKQIQTAVDIIAKPENKQKYSTLLYNAGIITINILKHYLKVNWAGNFYEILEKISALLEEADDVDHNWRIFILIKLAECYFEADKKAEGQKAIDKISDVLRKRGDCDFMDELFRMRIHFNRDNNGALGNIKKEADTNNTYPHFRYIYTVQSIKSNIITEKDFDKEVTGLIQALAPDFNKSIDPKTNKFIPGPGQKLEHWKADVLAELSFVLLRFKSYVQMGYNLYSFLLQNSSNSLKGKIYLENIKALKVIHDLEENLAEEVQTEKIATQKRIEARAECINILDRNMTGCARLQDYDLTNETAMLIFTTAMPFFQKDLRKYFYKAFYNSCDQLEQFNSNESYLRAAMHYELAKYYLGEDLLQEAKSHVLKALNNDYSIPLAKLGGNSTGKDAKGKAANANQPPANDQISLTNSINNNVSYLQRNLEEYLVYLKRYIDVKINVYNDPDNTIDMLIFETDNVKNAKNPTMMNKTIAKCLDLIKDFKFDEFTLPKTERDFVEEEIQEMKTKHDLKLYDDKKHFINVCSEIAKYCFDLENYEPVLTIHEAIDQFTSELSTVKDIEQLIGITETKLLLCQVFSEKLLDEGLEVCANNYSNFLDPNKTYKEEETSKFEEWRSVIYDHLKEANKIATSINQYWLIFKVAKTLWNFLCPFINAPNVFSLLNENLIPVFQECFDSMINCLIYYESIGAEFTYNDYYTQIQLFVNVAFNYARFLEFKQKVEECVSVCDTSLSRKLESKYRKLFDTLKARVTKVDTSGDVAGNAKKKAAPPKAAPAAKKGESGPNSYTPTQDQVLISDCFVTLENSRTMEDPKAKLENLKKGLDSLKNYKINFNDEATIEIASELYFKYGVQFFSLKTNEAYKYAILCSENCVNTYGNEEIAKKRKNISLTLQKWYALGFLLYGDCLLNLINEEKQERLCQIDLYFKAIDKILISAKIAEKAKLYLVIIQVLKAFYSIVINVIDQPQNRINLCKNFEYLHNILINNKAGASVLYGDPEFLLLFYSIFFICINETKKWDLGEKMVSDVMKIIPSQFHHILLEHKLFYFSKQGKSFLQNLNGGSGGNQNDKDLLSKAKLFTKLARNSTNKLDQFNAYNKAIEMLKNDQNIYVANVIFELSTWLYKNNYPYSDVEENLNSAADVILEIDSVFDEDDEVEDDMQSKRSGSSRRSRLSKRSKSKKSGVSSSKKMSKAGMSKSKMSERSKSRNYSSHSSKTKTIFAKMLDYDPYPLYINLNHYEELFKILVFLSIVSGSYNKKQTYLLDSYYVIRKILEMSIKTYNCIAFYEKNKEEITSNNFISNEINALSTFISNYFITKDMNVPQVVSLPDTLDGLIDFEFPEEFLNRIVKENEINADTNTTLQNENESLPNYTMFCKKSFESRYQFYYYFNYLLDAFLNEFYFHTEAILLLKFGILFAKYILENKEIEYAYYMKLSKVIFNIVTDNPKVNGAKNAEKILKKINEKLKTDFPEFNDDIIAHEREELRKYDLNLNTNNESHFLPANSNSNDNDEIVMYCDDLRRYRGWLALAEEFYLSGQYSFSKDYCNEVVFHSLVVKDKFSFLKATMILAQIEFLEGKFEESSKKLNKIQTLNENPAIMFEVIRNMVYIFDYNRKYIEKIFFLNPCLEFLESQFTSKLQKGAYYSSPVILLQMINFTLISLINAKISSQMAKISMNEITILKEQMFDLEKVLNFYSKEISPLLQKLQTYIRRSSLDIYTVYSLYNYILNSIKCFSQCNLFALVNKEQLEFIRDNIFTQNLNLLDLIFGFLNEQQSFVPYRVDNSLVYLPLHRMIAFGKILYATINNKIGEFLFRVQKICFKSEKISMNDPEIAKKFGENVKFNQTVIDYINDLTKEIGRIKRIDKRDDAENISRYQRSISLLTACDSLIPSNSNEYLLSQIEKINSFRLQAAFWHELSFLWDPEVLEEIKLLQNPPEEDPNNATKQNSPERPSEEEAKESEESIAKKKKKSKLQIRQFHQYTINLISDFEKNILGDESYTDVIADHPLEMVKYYFNVLETSGYFNIELSFKSLCDYQNKKIQDYYQHLIPMYINPESNDWSIFALEKTSNSTYSFGSGNPNVYSMASQPDPIKNYKKYIKDIPYFKAASANSYKEWNEVKQILPNNSSIFILEMNEDRTILYIGFMYMNDSERTPNYYIKRLNLDTQTNAIIDDLLFSMRSEKYNLIKTVYPTKDDIQNQFLKTNDAIEKILNTLENELPIFKEPLTELNDIINPTIVEEEKEEDNKGANAKASTKKTAPAAGKKDKGAVVSDLPLPTSNIEQILFLIDKRLMDLPIDNFSIFSKIPYKSIDFSLNSYITKLKAVNYTPSSGSVITLNGGVKYYLDYSTEQDIKSDIKASLTNHLGGATGGKKDQASSPLDGVFSSEHMPSIAELQKLYIESNIFFFVSQTALLYQMPYDIFDCSRYSKCKVGIILDRIATEKNFVKDGSLKPKTFSLHLQPIDTLALMNLTGIVSVLFTRWSMNFNECSELMEDILDESEKGVGLSYAINKYKNPKRVLKEEEGESKEQSDRPKSKSSKNRVASSTKNKKEVKKEEVVLDENNSIEVKKMRVFTCSPTVFGLNNVKIV